MTMKTTTQFRNIHDKNSGLSPFKTVTGIFLNLRTILLSLKNACCNRYDLEGDLSETLTHPKFDRKESSV